MTIDDRDLVHHSTPTPDGLLRLELVVPDIHCGNCIQTIETALCKLSEVTYARVNLSTKRVTVCFPDGPNLPAIGATFKKLGFEARISAPINLDDNPTYPILIRSLGVAAFAAMNIMMLSVAVWAGAIDETRQLFHWISAAIALPALIYSGRVFYISAWNAILHGRANMDVPISIGLAITYAMSLYDTIMGGDHAYFDAATTLLFFLLIGRTLDYMMREKTRTALTGLSEFISRGAQLVGEDNLTFFVPLEQIERGMTLRMAAGDRIAVDGVVKVGSAELDVSHVSGESSPLLVACGDKVSAGSLLLSGPLDVEATANAENSLLSQMTRLIEAAEQGRGRYRRLADRVSSLYAPIVHLAAIAAFIGWMWIGSDVHFALTVAVSVLIITCPCALALAVPMVQIVAAQKLFGAGILMKEGSALERLAEIDGIAFDKTGTLTLPEPALIASDTSDQSVLSIARLMAEQSNHPYAKALSKFDRPENDDQFIFERIEEVPGNGVQAWIGKHCYRLGRRNWAVEGELEETDQRNNGPVLTCNGKLSASFSFVDTLRPETKRVVSNLQNAGLNVEILSGDTAARVEMAAYDLDIHSFLGGMRPEEKVRHLENMKKANRKPLMVGDGINDAPALAAAHVSMAPSNATDIGRNVADFVFMRNGIANVLVAINIANRASKLTRQNIVLALLYNAIALPFAFFGLVTPLYAAIAMSTSSLVVVANALRQRGISQQIYGGVD